jgi:hypothetical protein
MAEEHASGRVQVVAGASLLEFSRLVIRDSTQARFDSVPFDVCSRWWRTDFHPVFGRLISWVAFAAGA